MGFKVVELMLVKAFGVSLPNTEYTIHAGYGVSKNADNTFNIEAKADVYASTDHTKAPIDVIRVLLKNLPSLPADIYASLYAALKSQHRFQGKTIIDN